MRDHYQCSCVGTFRKVDAGMVRVAGELVINVYPLVNETERVTPASSTIRYLHVLQPEGAAVTGRRCSAPAVSSSVAPTAPGRRGSQPAVLQAEMMPGRETRQPRSFAVHIANRQGDTEKLPQGDLFIYLFSSQEDTSFNLTFPYWLTFSQILSLLLVLIYSWSRTQKYLRYLSEKGFSK